MSDKRIWIAGAVVATLLIAGGLTWALYPRESKYVVQAQELMAKMQDENLSQEDRQQLWQQFRELRESVPDDQREEVFRAAGEPWRRQFESRMREFASLPENERNAFLDQDIDRMETMRRQFEERMRAGGGERGPGGGFGGGPGGPGGGGNAEGRQGRGNWTDETRTDRRRRRLDNTTPEQRAHMTEYFRAMNERRVERGLEPMGPPFRGRPR